MSNYCAFRLSRFVRRVAILAWIGSVPIALAQEGQWKAASDGLIPMLGLETLTGQVNPQNTNDRTAPLALRPWPTWWKTPTKPTARRRMRSPINRERFNGMWNRCPGST